MLILIKIFGMHPLPSRCYLRVIHVPSDSSGPESARAVSVPPKRKLREAILGWHQGSRDFCIGEIWSLLLEYILEEMRSCFMSLPTMSIH